MNDEYQVLVSDFENETTANFKKCLKDSGFKQIVDNFKRKKEDFFNTRELLIDYVNDKGEREWVKTLKMCGGI